MPNEKNTTFNFSLLTYPLIFYHETLHNHTLELQGTITQDKCPAEYEITSASFTTIKCGTSQTTPKLSSF